MSAFSTMSLPVSFCARAWMLRFMAMMIARMAVLIIVVFIALNI